MQKIKELLAKFESAIDLKLLIPIFIVSIFGLTIITLLNHKNHQLNDIKKSNKATIKQSEKVIFEQQKEIQKLKKDVVLHSIIADSSIAKANRLSKKQVILQVELSRIDSVVNTFDEVDIDRYWSKRK